MGFLYANIFKVYRQFIFLINHITIIAKTKILRYISFANADWENEKNYLHEVKKNYMSAIAPNEV